MHSVGEVRLVAGALGELGGTVDQALGVARGVDYGLGVQVDDGTLLLVRLIHRFMEFCLLREGSPRWGVGVNRHRKELQRHAYRKETQNIRLFYVTSRVRVRSEFAAVTAAMTWRRRRPHAAAAPPSLARTP